MSVKVIDVSKAKELMQKSNGAFFTVAFIKKNGDYREMNCRLGVSKGVNGTGRSYEPAEYDLLGVFDMQKDSHRMVNLRTVVGLNISGEQYKVRA
jgi:hypothetical protein|tara:strand:+ start:912 stop:1196 length:285 start_codon:yes stop_codon:yes gene_type:complete